MEFTLDSTQVLCTLSGAFFTLLALILLGRFYLQHLKKKPVKSNTSQLSQRTKYPEYDVFRWRFTSLQLGMLFSLSFTLITLSWTSYQTYESEPEEPYIVENLFEISTPRTIQEPPKLTIPKVKTPPIIEAAEVLEPIEKPKLIEPTVEKPTVESTRPVVNLEPKPKPIISTPPPRPAEPVFDIPEIFEIVEEMPRFPGCEDIVGSIADKQKCADEKLMRYLYKNLKYPSIARENNVEGRLYVRFIVEKDGSISNTEIIRDIGAGCGEAAIEVVEKMNDLSGKWSPGRQRNTPVRVKYTLPVTFKLSH